jgi:uncharacterized membrane protein YphA (DoxX/SURF4 family)
MANDRQGVGLAIMRAGFGVFFIFEGIGKLPWFADASILSARLQGWLTATGPAAPNRWFLEHVAIPGATIFARLVPLGELAAGLGLLLGFMTPLCALVAFFMALTFQFASGALFAASFLTSGYGLPVLGPMFALALGGRRIPFTLR